MLLYRVATARRISYYHCVILSLLTDRGSLLFIAHARVNSEKVKCRLYGPCAVRDVTLNRQRQSAVTEDGLYIVTLSPLVNGRNEIVIHTADAAYSSAKLLVCGYNAQHSNI